MLMFHSSEDVFNLTKKFSDPESDTRRTCYVLMFHSSEDVFNLTKKFSDPESDSERLRIVEKAQNLIRKYHRCNHRGEFWMQKVL